eukprot:SAG22_NODE_1934_length_3291_cov_1.493734_3_plen_243_part_01
MTARSAEAGAAAAAGRYRYTVLYDDGDEQVISAAQLAKWRVQTKAVRCEKRATGFGLTMASATLQIVGAEDASAAAGICAGEQIVAVDGKPVGTQGQLSQAVAEVPAGTMVGFELLPGQADAGTVEHVKKKPPPPASNNKLAAASTAAPAKPAKRKRDAGQKRTSGLETAAAKVSPARPSKKQSTRLQKAAAAASPARPRASKRITAAAGSRDETLAGGGGRGAPRCLCGPELHGRGRRAAAV